jgi:hypothetical protein
VVGAILVGLLAATYVNRSEQGHPARSQGEKFLGGGLLAVFAIGCAVCNKLVVLAPGATGALTYFARSNRSSASSPWACYSTPCTRVLEASVGMNRLDTRRMRMISVTPVGFGSRRRRRNR